MKLKFIETNANLKSICMIGKTGQIRFKKNHVEKFNLKANSKFLIGYDEEENPVKKIYLLPSANSDGFKMYYQNSSYFVSAKTVVSELKLKIPLKCEINSVEISKEFPIGTICLSF